MAKKKPEEELLLDDVFSALHGAKDLVESVDHMAKGIAKLKRGEVADILGDVRAVMKRAAKVEGFVKEVMKAKLKPRDSIIMGTHWKTVISEKTRVSLDGEKVCSEMREELGDEEYEVWYAEHSKETTYIELSTKPVGEE